MAEEAVEGVEEEEEEEKEEEEEDVEGKDEDLVGMSDEAPLAKGRGGVFPEFSNCKTSLISPPSAATS